MGGMPMGGMPMGGGAAGGGEDIERKNSILKEAEDIWGENETPTTPPVIGEVGRRA